MNVKIVTIVCIFLIFTSFGCLGENEEVEVTRVDIEQDDVYNPNNKKFIQDDFKYVGTVKVIEGSLWLDVFYDNTTDIVVYYHRGSLDKETCSVICVATIPEPEQSIIREQYGIGI